MWCWHPTFIPKALRETLKMRLQQLEELAKPAPGRGLLFELKWTGALIVDAGFTSNTPLACLAITNGCFTFRRPPSTGEAVPRHINFQCQGGCVKDARREDISSLLIDLPCASDGLSLQVLATMPAVPVDPTEIKIDLRQWEPQNAESDKTGTYSETARALRVKPM